MNDSTNTVQAAPAMELTSFDLQEKKDGKFVKVGSFQAPAPNSAMLDSLISTDSPVIRAWVKGKLEQAVAVLVKSRQTAGNAHPSTLEAFCTPSEKGSGEALALRRAAIASFCAYLTSKGVKEAKVAYWRAALSSAGMVVVASQSDAARAKLNDYVEGWISTLSGEQAEGFTSFVQAVSEAITSGVDLEGDD